MFFNLVQILVTLELFYCDLYNYDFIYCIIKYYKHLIIKIIFCPKWLSILCFWRHIVFYYDLLLYYSKHALI